MYEVVLPTYSLSIKAMYSSKLYVGEFIALTVGISGIPSFLQIHNKSTSSKQQDSLEVMRSLSFQIKSVQI